MNSPSRRAGRPPRVWLLLLAVAAVLGPADAAELSLTWSDNSDNENGFTIERRIGTEATYSEIATTGPDVGSYVDSTVGNGSTYCYRVSAFNAGGDSEYSNEACGTTPLLLSLSVVKSGTGSGTVTSSPAGIYCGTSCSATFSGGTMVSLTATPAAGSIFAGWSGVGCSGSGTCTVAIASTDTVMGTFNQGSGTLKGRSKRK
jgi:Divergent InlB B-repeat domain